jgi:competence protein ComEC
MALIMGGAILAEREPDLLNALAGAGIVGLLLNPWEVISPSFWLSFAAVIGLILFAPAHKSLLVSGFIASLAASIATAPLVGFWFGSIPLVGILVTLLTGPLALILMGFSLAAWLIWLAVPALGPLLGVLCEGMASWMLLVFVQFGGPWSLSLAVPEFSPWWLGPFYILGILMAPGTKSREGRN